MFVTAKERRWPTSYSVEIEGFIMTANMLGITSRATQIEIEDMNHERGKCT